MTSHHQPSKGRARVMWAEHTMKRPFESTNTLRFTDTGAHDHCIPVLVIPCPSLKSARARKKWEGMSEEEKVEAIAKALCSHDGLEWSRQFDTQTSGSGGEDGEAYLSSARAVLAVTEGRG